MANRPSAIPVWLGILLLAGAFALGAASVDDRVAFAVGTAGALLLTAVALPGMGRGAVAVSWMLSFAAALAVLWLLLLDVVSLDPLLVCAGLGGVMLGSLLLARVLGGGR